MKDVTLALGTRALAKDPLLGPIIRRSGPLTVNGNRRYFVTLIDSIISQQISGKAAEAILKRLKSHCKRITPKNVAAVDFDTLRSLGLSPQKAGYVLDLSAKFLDGTIKTRRFAKLSDEEIIAELVAVKGIGRWTAEMFLIFSLTRTDVWPVDDYGVQKAVQRELKLRTLPDKKKMRAVGERWKPYRSVAALYLWKSLQNR